MWAHYGDKHKGVCLGFDVIGAEAYQVTYQSKRLSGLLEHIGSGQPLIEAQMHAILTTKFRDWSYEREWRMFGNLDQREATDGKYYLNFDPHIILREVILGSRCSASPRDIADKVVPSKARVEVFQARPAFQSFRIVRQKDEPSVFVAPKTSN